MLCLCIVNEALCKWRGDDFLLQDIFYCMLSTWSSKQDKQKMSTILPPLDSTACFRVNNTHLKAWYVEFPGIHTLGPTGFLVLYSKLKFVPGLALKWTLLICYLDWQYFLVFCDLWLRAATQKGPYHENKWPW